MGPHEASVGHVDVSDGRFNVSVHFVFLAAFAAPRPVVHLAVEIGPDVFLGYQFD